MGKVCAKAIPQEKSIDITSSLYDIAERTERISPEKPSVPVCASGAGGEWIIDTGIFYTGILGTQKINAPNDTRLEINPSILNAIHKILTLPLLSIDTSVDIIVVSSGASRTTTTSYCPNVK